MAEAEELEIEATVEVEPTSNDENGVAMQESSVLDGNPKVVEKPVAKPPHSRYEHKNMMKSRSSPSGYSKMGGRKKTSVADLSSRPSDSFGQDNYRRIQPISVKIIKPCPTVNEPINNKWKVEGNWWEQPEYTGVKKGRLIEDVEWDGLIPRLY
jgi:hypothetical protein